MKRLRFWQRVYLAVLAVFLVALNGGLVLAGWRCYEILLDSEIDQARSDQLFIARSLARDLTASGETLKPFQVKTLAHTYASQFLAFIRVELNGQTVYTSPGYDNSDPTVHAEPGTQHWEKATFANGGDYIVVGGLTDDVSDLQVTLAHSLAHLEVEWDAIVWKLMTTSIAVSAVGAVGLFFTLRRLGTPLQRLASVTDAYASGDRAARATVQGNDEIATLATSFNNLADSVDSTIEGLEQAAETNARMAASLSHEVRTPLTAIRGYAEYLMIANATPEERAQAAEYVIHESTRLQRIAERMLQLFAVERTPLDLHPVSLARIVSTAVATVEPKTKDAGMTVEASLPTSFSHRLEGDEVLLESLVVNLLDNAVSASEPGDRIRVSLEEVESAGTSVLRLTVIDEGRGLAPEELARLGEPFYRPDKARSRAQGGAGLGAALVNRIAKVHGATLSYASEPGRGTKVTVDFPSSRLVDAFVTSDCDDEGVVRPAWKKGLAS